MASGHAWGNGTGRERRCQSCRLQPRVLERLWGALPEKEEFGTT